MSVIRDIRSRSTVLLVTALLIGSCGTKSDPRPAPAPNGDPAAPQVTESGAAAEATALQVQLGSESVDTEVADDSVSRAKGLSGRTALEDGKGMIFLYPKPSTRRFWMKGCLMALDIAYLDADRRIIEIGSLEPPDSADLADDEIPSFSSSAPALYVLETRKGWFADKGIRAGTQVVFSPALAARADRLREPDR